MLFLILVYYSLVEASVWKSGVIYMDELASPLKYRENGQTLNFPVKTIACNVHGIFRSRNRVDIHQVIIFSDI